MNATTKVTTVRSPWPVPMPITPDSKLETYKLAEEIVNKFQEQCHSLVCRELKGLDAGKVLTPCPDCIMNAARIAEEVLDLKV